MFHLQFTLDVIKSALLKLSTSQSQRGSIIHAPKLMEASQRLRKGSNARRFLWWSPSEVSKKSRAAFQQPVKPPHISLASVSSPIIPNPFISCSQNESLNFGVSNQKIHYSRNMPRFMIKTSQAAHCSFIPARSQQQAARNLSVRGLLPPTDVAASHCRHWGLGRILGVMGLSIKFFFSVHRGIIGETENLDILITSCFRWIASN